LLRKLRRLLLRRLRRRLPLQQIKLVEPLDPQVNLAVREAKETPDPTARPEILVLAEALARRALQALLDQAEPLV
jgi:hypothetical protein